MSLKVDEQLTRKVADLSRLALSESEVATFTKQLGDILGYIEKLNECDVSGVVPMTQPFDQVTPLREDRVIHSPTDQQGEPLVLRCAPEVVDHGFKVHQVVG